MIWVSRRKFEVLRKEVVDLRRRCEELSHWIAEHGRFTVYHPNADYRHYNFYNRVVHIPVKDVVKAMLEGSGYTLEYVQGQPTRAEVRPATKVKK